jgi:aspartate aminotransferase-like enzyme
VWRIGLMGYGCSRRNVLTVVAALASALAAEGHRVKGDALAAARA